MSKILNKCIQRFMGSMAKCNSPRGGSGGVPPGRQATLRPATQLCVSFIFLFFFHIDNFRLTTKIMK